MKTPRFVCVSLLAALMIGPATLAQPVSPSAQFAQKVHAGLARLDTSKAYQSPASGTLAWGESYILTAYYWMFEATGDPAWLDRIVSHADVIFANLSQGDELHPGWRTPRYSVAIVEAEAKDGNRSRATIAPDPARIYAIETAQKVTGHTYDLVISSDGEVEISDRATGEKTAAAALPADGRVTAIPGVVVVIEGKPAPGDRFEVRTQAPKAMEHVVHDGMILTPIAKFCAAVLGDDMGAPSMGGPSVEGPRNPRGLQDRAPIAREELARSAEPAPSLHSGQALSLSKGPRALQARYGAAARRYLRMMETQLIPKWEPYWRDLPDGGGVYLWRDDPAQRFPGATLPHNQYLALGRTHIALYRITGKPLYRERAERMARFFKSKLRRVDDHYEWNYWDAAGTWDDAEARRMQHIEDTSHGHIDIGFAIDAYDAGLVFDRRDMARFARTVSDAMWNRSDDAPRLGGRVNTREVDLARADRSVAAREWIRLGRFSATVRRIMMGLLESLPSSTAPDILAGAQMLALERMGWPPQPRYTTAAQAEATRPLRRAQGGQVAGAAP